MNKLGFALTSVSIQGEILIISLNILRHKRLSCGLFIADVIRSMFLMLEKMARFLPMNNRYCLVLGFHKYILELHDFHLTNFCECFISSCDSYVSLTILTAESHESETVTCTFLNITLRQD